MDAALGEAPQQPQPAAEVVQTLADAAIESIEDAVARVIKESLATDGVKCGLNQVVKAIESGRAHVVFLAEDVEEPKIGEAVILLCKRKNIALVKVPESKELGRWVGLCKIDAEGQARKIVGASSVAILDYGAESPAYHYLLKHIKAQESK